MPDPNNRGQNLQTETPQDLTLALIPESLIVGNVSLPTSEAPDSIGLQIFRREVQNGHGHWTPAGNTQSKSDGQFRFADLPAGTYKVLTLSYSIAIHLLPIREMKTRLPLMRAGHCLDIRLFIIRMRSTLDPRALSSYPPVRRPRSIFHWAGRHITGSKCRW